MAAAGANDTVYRGCQDTIGDAAYMDTALQHAQERGLRGALTIGFLYDTELNFGDGDEAGGIVGAIASRNVAARHRSARRRPRRLADRDEPQHPRWE